MELRGLWPHTIQALAERLEKGRQECTLKEEIADDLQVLLDLIQYSCVPRPRPPRAGMKTLIVQGRILAEAIAQDALFQLDPNDLLRPEKDLVDLINRLREHHPHSLLAPALHVLRHLGNVAVHLDRDSQRLTDSEIGDAAAVACRFVVLVIDCYMQLCGNLHKHEEAKEALAQPLVELPAAPIPAPNVLLRRDNNAAARTASPSPPPARTSNSGDSSSGGGGGSILPPPSDAGASSNGGAGCGALPGRGWWPSWPAAPVAVPGEAGGDVPGHVGGAGSAYAGELTSEGMRGRSPPRPANMPHAPKLLVRTALPGPGEAPPSRTFVRTSSNSSGGGSTHGSDSGAGVPAWLHQHQQQALSGASAPYASAQPPPPVGLLQRLHVGASSAPAQIQIQQQQQPPFDSTYSSLGPVGLQQHHPHTTAPYMLFGATSPFVPPQVPSSGRSASGNGASSAEPPHGLPLLHQSHTSWPANEAARISASPAGHKDAAAPPFASSIFAPASSEGGHGGMLGYGLGNGLPSALHGAPPGLAAAGSRGSAAAANGAALATPHMHASASAPAAIAPPSPASSPEASKRLMQLCATTQAPPAAKVQQLLEAGANVLVSDKHGMTPLHLSAYWCHAEVAELLLRHCPASAGALDKEGRSPLWVAAQRGHVSVLHVLLEAGASPRQPNNSAVTPLRVASALGHAAAVAALLAAGAPADEADKDGFTPLYVACARSHVEVVALLLGAADVQVDRPDRAGRTPLWAALHPGTSSKADTPTPDRRNAVLRALLAAGADVHLLADARDRDACWTVLAESIAAAGAQ